MGMPLLKVSLSFEPTPEKLRKASETGIEILSLLLDKPSSVTMFSLQTVQHLQLGLESETACLIEILGIDMPPSVMPEATAKFCEWAETLLEVCPASTFVIATPVPRGLWGGNRKVY